MIPEVTLSSFNKPMPIIGMGTSSYPRVDFETEKSAILEAIKCGYRHFDTAFAYGSEKALGVAIAEALNTGLVNSRDDFFITSKLFPTFAERHRIVPAIKISLENLGLDYLDMYLIHWPLRISREVQQMPIPEEYIVPLDIKSVWEGMEECQNLGLTKGIGVSNFSTKKLHILLSSAKIPPAVNQVEMNPMWQQKQLREYCKEKGIHITAYSPLGAKGTKWGDDRIINSDVLEDIAKSKGKTTAQISLRWVYEQGCSLVTKSFNKERMKENLNIFDWSLTSHESHLISQLPQRKGVLFASILGPIEIALELDAEV